MLLDVDGTVVDSADVILRCFLRTAQDLDLPRRPVSSYHRFIGPPLATSFEELGLTGAVRERAVGHYRSLYQQCFLEAPPFPGVATLVEDLHAAGLALATATSKQEPMARTQLDHLGLARLVDVIAGATPDPRCTKATVVRDALTRLARVGRDVSRPVLLGDRVWDVRGGEEAGVPVIGAGWGYAEPGELSGALAVAHDVAEARDLLLGTGAQPAPAGRH